MAAKKVRVSEKKVKVSIAISPEVLKRVDRLAKVAGSNRSKMLQELVEDSIEQQEHIIKAATDPVLMNAMAKLMVEPGMLRAMTSALREDLTSDQLDLFKQHMAAIESRVRPVGEVLEDQRRRASKKNG